MTRHPDELSPDKPRSSQDRRVVTFLVPCVPLAPEGFYLQNFEVEWAETVNRRSKGMASRIERFSNLSDAFLVLCRCGIVSGCLRAVAFHGGMPLNDNRSGCLDMTIRLRPVNEGESLEWEEWPNVTVHPNEQPVKGAK